MFGKPSGMVVLFLNFTGLGLASPKGDWAGVLFVQSPFYVFSQRGGGWGCWGFFSFLVHNLFSFQKEKREGDEVPLPRGRDGKGGGEGAPSEGRGKPKAVATAPPGG